MVQMNNAIKVLLTMGLSAGTMVFAGGCADDAKPAQSAVRGDVTDIRPIEPATPAAYQPPLYDNTGLVPTAPQAITGSPVVDATPSATSPMLASTASGQTHTVRKGETLFSISKATYGSGRDWKKIVEANPGVTPSKLKVGQILAMP